MKKLMVMLGAVALAAGVQAAAVSWSATNISKGNGITWSGNPSTKGSGYQAYVFLTASTATAADADYIVDYATAVSKIKSGDSDILAKAVASAKTTSNGAISNTLFGNYGTSDDDAISAFMIVFDNADPALATYVGISAETDVEIAKGATSASALPFNTFTATNGWTKMESVPEPTSGLLLLLGVAGLALRRRRA